MKRLRLRKSLRDVLLSGYCLVQSALLSITAYASVGRVINHDDISNSFPQNGFYYYVEGEVDKPYREMKRVDENTKQFVLLNIGSYDKKDKARNIDKYYEKGIAVGLIIEPNKLSEKAMIENVQYAFEYLKKYNDIDKNEGFRNFAINFPIMLDISPIINSEKLTDEEKENIINTFVDYAEYCYMFAALKGTSTDLDYCEKNVLKSKMKDIALFKIEDGITDYRRENVYLKQEENSDKVISLYKSAENEDYLAYLIEDLGFNDPVNYKSEDDYYEFIKPKKTEKKNNSILDPSDFEISKEYASRMIDISSANCATGIENIVVDEEKFFNSFDLVILKVMELSQNVEEKSLNNLKSIKDAKAISTAFLPNYNYMKAHNKTIGFYFITRARNQEQAEAEATYLLEYFDRKNIEPGDFPFIFVDYEGHLNDPKQKYYDEDLNEIAKIPGEFERIMNTFEEKFNAKGFNTGLYTNQTTAERLEKMSSKEFVESKWLWISGGANYNSGKSVNDIEVPNPVTSFNFKPQFQQCTQYGIIDGLKAGNKIDFGYAMVDLEKIKNGYEVEEEKSHNKLVLGGALLAGAVGTIYVLKKRRKDDYDGSDYEESDYEEDEDSIDETDKPKVKRLENDESDN